MNLTLFKATLKSTWVFVVGVTLFIMIYVSISIVMYDPTSAEAMEKMFEMMPEGFLKALGFDNLGSELTPYLSNYLYGFIMLIFPMIASIVLANGLIAKHVDTGSMAYLLTTPNTRIKVVLTQAIYLILAMLLIFIVNIGIAIIMCTSRWGGMLDISAFLQLNLVTFMVALAISGISFLASCIFSDAKLSLAFGAGIPILLFVMKMLSEISEKVEVLRYLTVYTLIDINRIIGGDSTYVLIASLILLGIVAIFYSLAITIFNKKSLVI